MKKTLFILGCLLIMTPVAWGKLSAAKFPGTFEDISFKSRIDALTDGYKPMFDKQLYQELNVVPGEEKYTDHMIAVLDHEIQQREEDKKSLSHDEYCEKYPYDDKQCPEKKGIEEPDDGGTAPSYSGYTIGGGPVVENYHVTGGSCYPADHDRWYKNKIFTTGRFEKQYPAFEKGLISLFRKEGTTCGTIPRDPGGYTCMGISARYQEIPPEVLKTYTIQQAEDLYYERFWSKHKLYKLPDVIAADIFLAGVGSGMKTALNDFRLFLGLSKGYTVDDQMINAVNNYNGDIHNRWMDRRAAYLRKVAKERYKDEITYDHAVELKRKNGCHVKPQKPLYRK